MAKFNKQITEQELQNELYSLINSKQKHHQLKNLKKIKSTDTLEDIVKLTTKVLYAINFKLIPTQEKVNALTTKDELMQYNLQKYIKNLEFLSELRIIVSKAIYKNNSYAKNITNICNTYIRNSNIEELMVLSRNLSTHNKNMDRKLKLEMRQNCTYQPFKLLFNDKSSKL